VKAYVVTTGTVFALIVATHIWRAFEEAEVAKSPVYIILTAVAAGLALWAWRVLKTMPRS
jgi:hypothetical protein